MNPDRHMTELSLPPDSAVHQALALLRDERNAARREAAHYRERLEDVEILLSQTDVSITFARSVIHRALLWEGKQRRRTLRDRAAAWWTTRRILWARWWDATP